LNEKLLTRFAVQRIKTWWTGTSVFVQNPEVLARDDIALRSRNKRRANASTVRQ
uniref:Transposase n=1 Tax=Haemonchus placei TaxID=6290 RepID=A0A0N4W0V6_HAEPC